jgi:hypothetical protein
MSPFRPPLAPKEILYPMQSYMNQRLTRIVPHITVAQRPLHADLKEDRGGTGGSRRVGLGELPSDIFSTKLRSPLRVPLEPLRVP